VGSTTLTSESSPLDFFLALNGYPAAQDFFGGLGDFDKRSQPEVAQLSSSLSFASWRVWRYLNATRVPRQMLQALFDTVRYIPGAMPTKPQWLYICIALTPPFLSLEPHRILDLRPENKRRTKGWADYEGRAKLIADLAESCLPYEQYVMQQDLERIIRKTQRLITRLDLRIAALDFYIRRERESLPEAFKWERSAHVTDVFTETGRILENLPPDRSVDSPRDKTHLSGQYNQLLTTMYTAFNTHMPRTDYPHYPDGAKHAALSAILSPLLYPDLLPRPNSTTQSAIQGRLRNRKPA